MNNREELVNVIRDLREELRDVRVELQQLNEIVTSPTTDAEVGRRVQYLTESFDAIVPESRLSGAQRFQRRIAFVQPVVRPIIKFMAGFVMKAGTSYDDIMSAANAPSLVLESRAVVDRTVTARTFKTLVKVEAIQSLIQYHLTDAEINAIEASMISRSQ